MAGIRDIFDHTGPSLARHCSPRLECRECQVTCERVVSPWRCLKARQTCVYAYQDGQSTYFGCLHKVFAPELDLKAFSDESGARVARSDPYGPLRVVRAPRPQCPVSVERAYSVESARERCVNPGFLRETFRVWVRGSEQRGVPGPQDDCRRSS